jgi:release factor glutamine methyltransferase
MPSRKPNLAEACRPELEGCAGRPVPSPVAPEARTQNVGEGQGGGGSQTSDGGSKWEAGEPHTVGWVLRASTARLADAGIEGAGSDARRLLAVVLDAPAAALLREPERTLTDAQLATLDRHVARRASREPVSRILGRRDFYGRSFTITPATLDPRPDSETLVTEALQTVREERWEQPRILDVGTGSGCLLLTLLCELAGASGTGTDISPEALAVARANAERLGVARRATWLTADALESVGGPFHILVSNPPYVRSGDIQGLDPEVRCYDPVLSLDGGPDGLAFFRRLAARILGVVPDGWVILEVGFDQADAVASILSNITNGVDRPRIGLDVAGKRRCVAVRTRARADASHA